MLERFYTLGLDIGAASVGWAVVEIEPNPKEIKYKRLLSTGVRTFERAIQEGVADTPASTRREKRSIRRTIRRRRYRMENLKKLLLQYNFLSSLAELLDSSLNPWQLRSESLDRKLSDLELSKVILHISKRRGFKSNRKNIELDGKDGGAFAKFINHNRSLLEEKAYRSIGEMFYKDKEFSTMKRNKRGNYKAMISRQMLLEELTLILNRQKEFGNKKLTDELIKNILDIFSFQRPFASGESISELVGQCTLIPGELRAPKHSISFGKFRAWQQLNNNLGDLINPETSEVRRFSKEEKHSIINLMFDFTSEITYKKIREYLKIPDEFKFIVIQSTDRLDEKSKVINPIFSYHELKRVIKKIDENYWDKLKDNHEYLDKLVYGLTVYKTDEDIQKYFHENRLLVETNTKDEIIANLPTFSEFGYISLKAINRLLPHLQEGLSYTQSLEKEGLDKNINSNNKNFKLPPLLIDTLTNPLVKRAAAQTVKVINAIIKKYGSPTFIQIELGRDLKQDDNSRRDQERKMKENESVNRKIIEELKTTFNINNPSGTDITKYKLWKEQNEFCVISQKPIPAKRLFEPHFTQIDHAIPYSRSFDDKHRNKIVVLTEINQIKADKTPFEYLGNDENADAWKKYSAFINSLSLPKNKKANILKTNAAKTEKDAIERFKSRDLNDMRYASRMIKDHIDNNLKFKEFDRDRRVFVVQGQFTNYLRKRYGFNKDRELNDRHHALDAVMIAISTPSMALRIAEYSKSKWLKSKAKIDITAEKQAKHFPEPWKGFRNDVESRVNDEGEKFEEYKNSDLVKNIYVDVLEDIRPLFVSRAPKRKVKGAAHKETIYSVKGFGSNGKYKIAVRENLENSKPKRDDLNLSYKEFYQTDPAYISALENRIIESDGKTEKAFVGINDGKSVISKVKEGNPIYSIISSDIKSDLVELKRGSGKGYAVNVNMIRTDIFFKDNKYYPIPIYSSDIVKKGLPNKSITAHKSKDNWNRIDDTYKFLFSLYPNDYIKLKRKKDMDWEEGYFLGTHSGTGQINFKPHDGSKINGKEKLDAGLKTIYTIKKYQVDVLGNLHEVRREVRLDFKNYKNGVQKHPRRK